MTTETETGEGQSFAEFEAATLKGEAPDETTTDEPNPEVNDELELTEGDEIAGDDEDGEDGEHKDKRRSKPLRQRLGEVSEQKNLERAARIKAEEEREYWRGVAEGRIAPKVPEPTATTEFVFNEPEPDPSDDKYEFGEADSQYIKDLARYEGRKAYAEEKHKSDQESAVTQQQVATRETLTNLDNEWQAAEARGAEKYQDFAEKIEDFKANAPCPPVMAIAIQDSPVGEDVVYHLASNPDTAELIAAELAGGDLLGAAKRFGELEGQYMTERPQRPSANAHPADLAMYAGRLKGFLDRKTDGKPEPKRMTSAPEPVKHNVRGGGGKFSVDDDTDDFAAFERKIMGGR